MWWWASRLFIVGATLGLSGCGYTLLHRLNPAFEGVKEGVFVPVFANETEEVGAEAIFTNALIRELQSRRQVEVVSRGSAKAVLEGTVVSISYGPTTYTELGVKGLASYRRLPSEYGVTVDVALRLVEAGSGKILWTSGFRNFQRLPAPVERTYSFQAPSSIGLATQSIVDGSYQDIARNIMRDVYDEMIQIF